MTVSRGRPDGPLCMARYGHSLAIPRYRRPGVGSAPAPGSDHDRAAPSFSFSFLDHIRSPLCFGYDHGYIYGFLCRIYPTKRSVFARDSSGSESASGLIIYSATAAFFFVEGTGVEAWVTLGSGLTTKPSVNA